VLQQLQHPLEADVTFNDAFRPVCRFFDRITRPEQLLTALPAAMRVLTDPADTGAVVLSLPQDIQSHAYDYPAGFFAERAWVIRRPQPDASEVEAVLAMLAAAERPLIIAGGGVIYSGATAELERLAGTAGLPVLETFAVKARSAAGLVADRRHRPGGHPRGQRPGREADLGADGRGPADRLRHRLALAVRQPGGCGSRASTSTRATPTGSAPTGIIADARQALAALAERRGQRGHPRARGLARPRRAADGGVGRGPGLPHWTRTARSTRPRPDRTSSPPPMRSSPRASSSGSCRSRRRPATW